ncbi:ParB/RepB/Spo0J family partition protein [Halalkalibacterium halodurans]|jgi:ParB family chromosome partitioning protein|uniref:ParB/RepB/Spo0J family partition protein n=1 Tax=Halalkalibacterium halodurans TaxID=86665 RepID=UPI002AA9966C|nr:ParB/RepB/Spo0J family partition protein [Halalkalibacterium halodurans]MDY7224572.1 ParB/RepB/Spo0J family partition protein [Halalkalibacterium halodurans]MDY7243857.1 ParB/RepB/Spo0J family partition protein [Halalkalibacterium halodurans]
MGKGLGKGLNAFFPEAVDETTEQVEEVKLLELRPNPYQPRKTFSEEALQELADSIKEHGILQPIVVRKSSVKGYEIVVGERRFRAAERAGLVKVPVVIRELDDQKMMEMALIENLQREDLNPIEEANAYEKLMTHLQMTQEQLAVRLGKSRPHIANHLRLLQLPKVVQEFISEGKLSMGHGRALLGLVNKNEISSVLNKILEEKLSVRQVEALVQQMNERVSRGTKKTKPKLSPFLKERQDFLRSHFGTSVAIKKGKKKGKIEIEFFSDDDLERILEMLSPEQQTEGK